MYNKDIILFHYHEIYLLNSLKLIILDHINKQILKIII